jgi:hypothetical protein
LSSKTNFDDPVSQLAEAVRIGVIAGIKDVIGMISGNLNEPDGWREKASKPSKVKSKETINNTAEVPQTTQISDEELMRGSNI